MGRVIFFIKKCLAVLMAEWEKVKWHFVFEDKNHVPDNLATSFTCLLFRFTFILIRLNSTWILSSNYICTIWGFILGCCWTVVYWTVYICNVYPACTARYLSMLHKSGEVVYQLHNNGELHRKLLHWNMQRSDSTCILQ